MKLSGKNIIGTEVLRSEESFVATSPLDGTVLDGRFEMAGVAAGGSLPNDARAYVATGQS